MATAVDRGAAAQLRRGRSMAAPKTNALHRPVLALSIVPPTEIFCRSETAGSAVIAPDACRTVPQ